MNGLAISDLATLTLEKFGLFNGKVTLASNVNETVGALYLAGFVGAPGTYGSTASSADFKDDTFFSGSGVLTVVPEPASAAFLVGGLGVFLGRRRRR
jgi:hypothetical protein